MTENVRMEDVRLYIRDVLKEYASLQTFKPKPSWNAVCYTGQELMDQFGFPYEYDRGIVKAAYPWLENWAKDECRGQLPRSKRPQKQPKDEELEES